MTTYPAITPFSRASFRTLPVSCPLVPSRSCAHSVTSSMTRWHKIPTWRTHSGQFFLSTSTSLTALLLFGLICRRLLVRRRGPNRSRLPLQKSVGGWAQALGYFAGIVITLFCNLAVQLSDPLLLGDEQALMMLEHLDQPWDFLCTAGNRSGSAFRANFGVVPSLTLWQRPIRLNLGASGILSSSKS
jgi:hypothetical protein